MNQTLDRRLWELRFEVEVASLYHDWRRGTLGTLVMSTRAAALIGAVISIVAVNALEPYYVTLCINVVGGITGLVILTDLAFGFDDRARRHEDLYRRCRKLQADIIADNANIAQLEADAQFIWRDEPPILWAIYAKCWNQLVARNETEGQYKKKVTWLQGLLGNIRQYSPQDFKPASS